MKVKISLLIISIFTLVSCVSKREKSGQLSEQAFEIYFLNNDLDKVIRADSALTLYNKAIELDSLNTEALENKIPILTEKRDVNGLIETTNRLVNIFPDKPYYKLQLGIFFLVKGEKEKGDETLKDALNDYKDQLDGDLDNFDFNMEFLTALTANEKIDEAEAHINLMKAKGYLKFQNQILEVYKIEVNAKEKTIKYFNSNKATEHFFE